MPLQLVPLEKHAGRKVPRAWLVCFSEVQLDVIGLLWANLGGARYNFVFTAQQHKANK